MSTTTSFSFNEEMRKRIDGVKPEKMTYSQFAAMATEEKVNRMESRDDRARKETMKRDVKILRPVVIEIVKEVMEEMR